MKKQTATNSSLKTTFGPLWKLFSDETVMSICIDAHDDISYVQKGIAKEADKIFKTSKELDTFISRVIKYSEKKLAGDQKSIFLNLDPYTRMNIVFPPTAVNGPSVIITRLPMKEVTLEDLIKFGALDREGFELIQKLIQSDKGILVSGNPGSGKTTLLNTLVQSIPMPQRVVTIERYADLVIHRKRVCRLQTENQKSEELVQLVSIAEKMGADYLVSSNFEGPEVMPFLELARNNCSAMGLITGDNSLDALKRLETKAVLSSEGMSLEDARYAIAQTFRYVIYQERRDGGKRLVSSIGEIQYESGELKLKVLYKR